MAGVSGTGIFGSLARSQYGAVLRMRWRLLLTSLRTKQGKFELGARIFSTAFFGGLWLLIGVACGVMAYRMTAQDQLVFLPALLWAVAILWQVVPVMLSAAQESVEFNFLLRFPVSFGSYLLLYLFFGVFDPASMLGGICVAGIWVGVVVANPGLVVWITLALGLFALFNFLLTRTIFAWIERWLAQRKTREMLGIVMLFVFLTFQVLNPALHRRTAGELVSGVFLTHAARLVGIVQGVFPPGLAGNAVTAAAKGSILASAGLLGGIAVYVAMAGALLAMRLRAEFRGENLGEAPVGNAGVTRAVRLARPIDARRSSMRGGDWLDGPVGALVVKEIRILLRSGVMLFGLVTPLILILLMGGRMRSDFHAPLQYAFPFALAWGFLPTTRQFCNSLGAEGAGLQLYFLSPTPFRSVMLAKNLLQAGLLGFELIVMSSITIYRFGAPSPALAFATLCWLLFALPANLAAGNLLSILLAYRMTLTRLTREQGSVGNGLLSLVIQLSIFAVGVGVYLLLVLWHRVELAGPIFLLLAVGSTMLWLRGLGRVDAMANRRREKLIATLVRAA